MTLAPETAAETSESNPGLFGMVKIGVRDHTLLKPGKLTDEEYEIMKTG